MNYFENLKALLREEQKYDQEQHEALLFRSSLQERRAQGVTWFPISISNSELGRGDYLTITIQKTNFLDEGHKFRFGMPVSLFSNHDPQTDRIHGLVSYVNRDTMRISIRMDELPDWSRRGKLGVDLLFDENSYREMFAALEEANNRKNDNKEGVLIRQLLGEEEFLKDKTSDIYFDHPSLNASQNEAIQAMLGDSPLILLHGPPGTGKTTTLLQGVQALLKKEKQQILIVAASNTAVDLLTERLDDMGVSVLRIGNPVRVSNHLHELTLDHQVDRHDANKERKVLEKQARAYTDMAHKYKRSFGKAEREQRKALFTEASKIRKEIDKIQDYIVEDIIEKVQVITATLVGANHYTIRDRHYSTMIIDEAAQALEPACWIPILKADRIIMAGDHCQLAPTIKSPHHAKEGLFHTLFEKLVIRFPESVSLLNTQYRMNKQIMHYSSQTMYGGQLVADPTVADRTLLHDRQPLVFIDTAGGPDFEETKEDQAIFNREEAYFVQRHIKEFLAQIEGHYDELSMPTVGIITPYRQQATLLKNIFQEDDILKKYADSIPIHTIDSFQGQEKDVIYISLTRSNMEQQIGFLADTRRMNVAMTRAKKKLIVIGDSATIGKHPFYKGFIDFVVQEDSYQSIWEWDIQS